MDQDELPVDPDVEVDNHGRGRPSPARMEWAGIGLVFAGGALGTLSRYLLSLVIPAWNGLPVPTFVINVTGAFLLGFLLVALTHSGPDRGARRSLRLFLGTGFLGGYTTYSAFAVDADGLIASADLGGAALYAAATVIVGATASFGGMALGFFAPLHRGDRRRDA